MRILTQRAVRKCPNCSLSAVGYNNKATQLCTIFLPTLFFHWFYFQQIERFLTDNNLRHVQNENEVQPGSFHFHSLALSRGISNYCPLFSIHKLHFSIQTINFGFLLNTDKLSLAWNIVIHPFKTELIRLHYAILSNTGQVYKYCTRNVGWITFYW